MRTIGVIGPEFEHVDFQNLPNTWNGGAIRRGR
jgi:hypothetical protein